MNKDIDKNERMPSLREKTYETNPFLVLLDGKMYVQPRANAIIAQGKAIIDKATGEITDDGILIGRRKYVDKSEFAKIYVKEIGLVYELSPTAKKVFLYMAKVMDFENKIVLHHTVHCQKVGYKNNSAVIRGLRELIQKNIIASSDVAHIYWVNPLILCKGERLAKFTEYIVDHSKNDTAKGMLAKQAQKTAPKIAKGLFDEHNENPYKAKGIK